MLLKHKGIRTLATDTMAERRALSEKFGAERCLNPRTADVAAACAAITDRRGADLVIIAASAPGIVEQAIRATRPGAKILLFAQTSDKERIELSGKDICMGERIVFGSYSADVDLQRVSADLVFSGAIPVGELVSHRFGLEEIARGFDMALHPTAESLKIVVRPQGHHQ
jgi:L-iditol 2-dehydrogenase